MAKVQGVSKNEWPAHRFPRTEYHQRPFIYKFLYIMDSLLCVYTDMYKVLPTL